MHILIYVLLFSLSVMSDSLQCHGLQHARLLCPPLSPSFLKFMSIKSVMPSNHLILCHPLPHPSAFNLSQHHGLFQWVFSLHQVAQSIGVSASTLPMNIHVQDHDSKASALWHSPLFLVQLSYPYMTTGKTLALTTQTSVSKVMSLLFDIIAKFVIVLLPRSRCVLIYGYGHHPQWFWRPRKYYLSLFLLFPFYWQWSNGARCHALSFMNVEFKARCFAPLFHSHQEGLAPRHLLPLAWHLHTYGCGWFSRQSWFQLIIPPAQLLKWCLWM